MTQLAFHLLAVSGFGPDGNMGYWAVQAVVMVCIFVVYLPVSMWLSTRRKEREAYYKAETLRRLSEAPTEAARETIALLREEERVKARKTREGMKIGGVVCIGSGLGVAIFLYALAGHDAPVYLAGVIPVLVGVAMLVYVYVLAGPVE